MRSACKRIASRKTVAIVSAFLLAMPLPAVAVDFPFAGGAGKWPVEFGRILSSAVRVRIWAHKDSKGMDHARLVAASLNGASFDVVVAAGECNDAAAHFAATGHPVIASAEQREHWAWCYADSAVLLPSRSPFPEGGQART